MGKVKKIGQKLDGWAINSVFVLVTLLLASCATVALAAMPPVTGPRPTTNTPPPLYVADTENLTRVANAISMQHKSLTILVTVNPGLVLTNPVWITVTYTVPATSTPDSTGFRQYVQSYVRSTGNRFLFNALEADGKPRRARVNIFLLEPKPGGGQRQGWSFNMPEVDLDLDPLYDVATGPLDFTLGDNCDAVGESQIGLHWYSPDGKGHSYNFTASAAKTITFPQFVWTRAEVSASANLHTPAVGFWKRDGGVADPNFAPSKVNLVPGKTRTIRAHEVFKQCRALIEYTITYSLSTPWTIKTPPASTVGNK